MGTVAGAQQIVVGLKQAGIDLVASVPDINMLQLINLLYEDKEITHVPVGREEEGPRRAAGESGAAHDQLALGDEEAGGGLVPDPADGVGQPDVVGQPRVGGVVDLDEHHRVSGSPP